MKKSIAAAGALACSALLAACGDPGGTPAPAPTVTVTETASSPDATTSSTGTTTSSPESTTSTTESTSTESTAAGDPRDSRGNGGDPALNSDDFPDSDSVTWADESPDSGISQRGKNVVTEMSESDAQSAGLERFTVKVTDNDATGLLTFPTSDHGHMTSLVEITGLGDPSQLECSIRVFDADGGRVPDSELTGNYRKLKCGGGFLVPEAAVGFTNPGQYTVVFGARSVGKDPAFIAVPVDVVE